MAIVNEVDFNAKKIRNKTEFFIGINDDFKLIYMLRGHKKIFINNSLYKLSVGDVCLIHQSDIVCDRTEQASGSEYIVLTFSFKYLKEVSDLLSLENIINIFKTKKITVPTLQHYAVASLIDNIYLEYIASTDIYSHSYLKLLLGEILIKLSRFSSNEISYETLNSHDERICEVCRHICNYYNTSLNLADMAKLAIMSSTYFSKKFKKVTGFGFNEYLNTVRMKIAINMLVQTNHSINEIALFCGYQDSNYFGDVFRRIIGMSPNKYRKTHLHSV